MADTRLIDRVRRQTTEGLTRPCCCCEKTTHTEKRPWTTREIMFESPNRRAGLRGSISASCTLTRTCVDAGARRSLVSLGLWCPRDLIENVGCAPCGVVIESCCISMFWKPGSYVVMLDHCFDSGLASRVMWAGAPGVGVLSSMPSRWTPDEHAVLKRSSCSLDHRQCWEKNCVDKQALCLVASSRSTSHASSSFFLASEAAFSRAPKRPLAIVLVTSPNLYSLLPVASRTAPSKPLMAPRVKSPNS